jgi:tRNA(Ile)-lysidine synthase
MLWNSPQHFYLLYLMSLLERFEQHWKHQFPNLSTRNCHLLLTVSGGADSVVLTDLIVKAGFNCTIAHCNFQLRGAESERDEQFVRALGDRYFLQVIVKKFETKLYAAEHKMSIQLAARDLRYAWFEEINNLQTLELASAEKIRNQGGKDSHTTGSGFPACYIVTGHHADDTIETVLMNFFRGTGILGLRGILPIQKDQQLIRPLLVFKKEELLNYATENGLSFVEDSSNSSDKYTRNYFRHQLIPSLKSIYSNVEENILNNIVRFGEIEELYQQSILIHKHKLLIYKGNEIHIPVLKLQKSSPLQTIVWEIIKTFNFSAAQVSEVIKLIGSDNGSFVQSSSHRVIKNRNWLIVAPIENELVQHILIESGDKKIIFANGALLIDTVKASKIQITSDVTVALLNADVLQFPLLLRKWKQGDYFYPLGMQKKKKLSRFFIDQKLSKTQKENVWIVEMNKKIIWVVNHRIDDRFKITASTESILKIAYLK